MCGICGVFNFKTGKPVDRDLIDEMNGRLHHRGPDQEGVYFDGPVGLAMKRLSIIDLSSGTQPIHDETKENWTVFNGEIYNYRELSAQLKSKGHAFYTQSDTEVLVHQYEEQGEAFANELNGMFAVALWDAKAQKLTLARDRAGIKPLYMAETEDGIAFSSEIKSLLAALPHAEEDADAIDAYLSLGYIPSPLSGIKQITKVAAGTAVSFDRHGKQTITSFAPYKKKTKSEPETSPHQLLDVLSNAVKRQLVSDVPVGLLLSGGIDSSLIAAICAKKLNVPLECFTIGFSDQTFDESAAAKETAQYLSLKNHVIQLSGADVAKEIENIVAFADEPLMDYSSIPTYFVTRFARSKVKVLLAGDGGDELFGGYPTHYLPKLVRFYSVIPSFLRHLGESGIKRLPASNSYMSAEYKLKRFIEGIGPDPILNHLKFKELFNSEDRAALVSGASRNDIPVKTVVGYQSEAKQEGATLEEQLMHIDFKTFLQDDCLQKSDRMSMANSIEVRVPFLDNEIIDYSRALSASHKVRLFSTKRLLRKALHELVPTGIAYRRKQGFTPPLSHWINNELSSYVDDSLRSNFKGKEWSVVEKTLNDHRERRRENSRQIWALLILGEWRKRHLAKAAVAVS